MRICARLWFDNDGKAFGQGPYQILVGVRKLGSLNQAAKELDLSYNKAWKTIQMVEKRIGFKLLESASGGKTGGGSTLTPEALEFMARYEQFREEVNANIQATFDKYFPE